MGLLIRTFTPELVHQAVEETGARQAAYRLHPRPVRRTGLTCLELVTEAVRAVLEDVARAAPELLDELVTAEWAERYGWPVRLCSQPSHPIALLEQVGAGARELLQRLNAHLPGGAVPEQAQVLRTILVQHFLVDGRGRFRPRTKRDGQPPSRVRIESPYETEARWTRRGDTRWTGYLAHVTET
jgi:hypothetical protein